jgi:chromosome segregation ATPase
MHSKLEPPEVIEKNVSNFTARVAEESTKVELVSLKLKEMKKLMSTRHKYYYSQLINTFAFIRAYFTNLFDSQPITGELDVDIPNGTLTVRAKFKGVNNEKANNLSGGERSITTVALALSVWSRLLIPFYMMDEFDVYMDMANRLTHFYCWRTLCLIFTVDSLNKQAQSDGHAA